MVVQLKGFVMKIYTNCKIEINNKQFDFTGIEAIVSKDGIVEKAVCLFTGDDMTGWFK